MFDHPRAGRHRWRTVFPAARQSGTWNLLELVKVFGDKKPYLQVDRVEGLVAIAQIGGVELHGFRLTGAKPVAILTVVRGAAAMEEVLNVASSGPLGGRRARAFAGVLLCNALEWYDFAIFGILAFNLSQAFFPNDDPKTSLLATLAVFGITFVARPLGALLLGGLGDSWGRKPALLITAAMMAVGTLLIGLIPSYDSVGILSPILLLLARLLQGLSAGGEWGAASSFLIEWAPQRQRGFWTSFLSLTVALGSGLASAMAAILMTLLPPDDVAAWGWRIPFLLGSALCVVCLWLRNGMDESPVYFNTKIGRGAPLISASRPNLLSCLTAFGVTIHWTVCYYMFLIYLPIFTRSYGQVTPAQSVWSNTICTVVIMILVPVVGWLSDRYGRRPFMLVSCAAVVLLTVPAFRLIAAGASFPQIVAVQVLFGVAIAFYSGTAPAVVAEQFPTSDRSRWSSVSYATAAAVFGGFAPFISVWLTNQFGSLIAPTIYVMTASTVSSLVVLRMRETVRMSLA